jgi:hypothetical protein
LFELATRFLSTQATGVSSGQVFFTNCDVHDYRCSSLAPKNAEMLKFLRATLLKATFIIYVCFIIFHVIDFALYCFTLSYITLHLSFQL